MEHVGFTVPDLDQALAFFVGVMGCEHIYELGPFQAEDDWMAQHLNVDHRTVMRRLAFLRCGHGSNFEIFEYETPERRLEQPRNTDIGGHHLAFYVDALQPALDHLRRHGVRILGEPTIRTDGASGGQSWIYFLTPWDMQLELVCFPEGKNYERTGSRRLWHPAHPAD